MTVADYPVWAFRERNRVLAATVRDALFLMVIAYSVFTILNSPRKATHGR